MAFPKDLRSLTGSVRSAAQLGYREIFELGQAVRIEKVELSSSVLRPRSREVWRKRALGERMRVDLAPTESTGLRQMSAEWALMKAGSGRGESLA